MGKAKAGTVLGWVATAAKSAFSVAKTIADAAGTVWRTLKPIIKKIWGPLKEVYNNVKRYVTPIIKEISNIYKGYVKPALEWVTKTLKTAIDTLDYVYRTVTDYIDKVTGGLFKTVMKLHDDAIAFKDKAIRLISAVDKKLAQRIDKKATEVIGYTLGWARRWYNELHEEITKVYLELRGELNKVYWAIQDVTTKIEGWIKPVERLVTPTIEKPGLLSRDTIVKSTQKYGKELFRELFKKQTGLLELKEIKVPPPTWVDKFADRTADEILQEKKGPWADVFEYLLKWQGYVLEEEDPGEFEFDLALLPYEERAEVKELDEFLKEQGIDTKKDIDGIIFDIQRRLWGGE